jgi:adenylate cyclase
MSGDPEQEYFADGITEDIITALSRAKWFYVIARNSSFTYKGRAADVRHVGQQLGARYALEGSVRRAGHKLRITAQLSETATGHQIWADRFEGNIEDIFELQDNVTEAIAGVIEPSLYSAEISLARVKPTESLSAYDLYLRALPHHYAMTPDDFAQALQLLHRAVEIDPEFSLAKAFLAFSYVTRFAIGWNEEGDKERAIDLARQALADHREDPTTLRCAGHTLAFLARDYDTALFAIERALALNPNSPTVLNSAGWIFYYALQFERAVDCLLRSIRLSPHDPDAGYSLSALAYAYLFLNRNEDAESCAARAIRERPNWSPGHRVRIFALVRLDRVSDAKAAVADYLTRWPDTTIRQLMPLWPLKNFMFGQEYEQALRIAGMPE